MKSILKISFATLMLATLSLAAAAQNKKQEKPKAKMEKKMKAHVCTQACHDSSKHVYAHGEKGHVCTNACKV